MHLAASPSADMDGWPEFYWEAMIPCTNATHGRQRLFLGLTARTRRKR